MPDPNKPRGPFAEPEDRDTKVGLKKIGTPSMFDNKPRKPSPQEFQERVQQVEDRKLGHQQKAVELFLKFNKSLGDKTLPQNKNALSRDSEREMLQEMVAFAKEMNSDPNEPEGEGSLMWITALLKQCLAQRDRINELEYSLVALQKKLESNALADYIKKEITKALDDKKTGG